MLKLNNIQAVLFIFMLAIIEEVEGCRPEPFHSLVIVDKNVERTDFVNNIVQNFPDGSIFGRQISFKGTFSSASMDNEIYMKLDENRKMAEIVLVFVNTGTILDGEPEFSRKKKTFVVVFGSSVPETWKNVATDDNHWFQVTMDSNSSISERLIKQLECDSNYYCDIDMYSKKKGQTCMPCSYLCGADPEQGSMTCSQYCPYVWSKSKVEILARSSSSTPIPVATYPVKHNKHTVGSITGVTIVVYSGVTVISVIIYCIKKRKQLRDRGVRAVPLSTAHQETEGKGYKGSPLINSGQEVDSNMPDERECRVNLNEAGLSSEGDDGADSCMTNQENIPIPIVLKNKQEADLNAHYSDENVRNIH